MDPIKRMYENRDAVAREKAARHSRPPQRFRASEVHDCARKIYYRLSGYAPAPRYAIDDDYGIDGDMQHDVVRWLMSQWGVALQGLDVDENGKIKEQASRIKTFTVDDLAFDVTGRIDGEIKVDDDWVLLEIKSVGYWPYKYMQDAFIAGGQEALTERIMSSSASAGYIDQMHVCMAIYGMRKGYLLIKDRSGCKTGVHNTKTGDCVGGMVVEWDEERWQTILKRLHMIRVKVNTGVPPLAGFPPGSDDCKLRCPFVYLCHDADKRRQRGLEPAVVYPDPLVQIEQAPEVMS